MQQRFFLYRFFLWLIGVPIFFDFLRIRMSQRNSIEVADTEQAVKRLSVQEEKYTAEHEKAFAEYNELNSQTESLDPVELFHVRETIRNECEEAAESRIRTASKDINFWDMTSARRTVDGKLDLYSEEQKVKRILWERKQNERELPQQKKTKDRGYER